MRGRNPEAGADTEAIEEHCSLACPSWLAQPAFFTTQGHLFEGGITHSGLGYPLSISNRDNVPGLQAGLSDEFIFSAETPLPIRL